MRRPSPAIFERGKLTDYLVAQFTAHLPAGILLGDHIAPKAGGWPGGQPGQGDFVPYTVLMTGEATPTNGPASLAQGVADVWAANYIFRSVGGLRTQTDWIADQVRMVWVTLQNVELDLGGLAGPLWRLQHTDINKLGAMARDDTTDPPFWTLTDTLTLTLARR